MEAKKQDYKNIKSIMTISEILKNEPLNYQYYQVLAQLYLNMGLFDNSKHWIIKLLCVFPNRYFATKLHLLSEFQNGNKIFISPSNTEYLFNLIRRTRSFARKDKFISGIELFLAYLNADTDSIIGMRDSRKDYPNCLAVALPAIEKHLQKLALRKYGDRNPDLAMESASRGLILNPGDPEFWYAIARGKLLLSEPSGKNKPQKLSIAPRTQPIRLVVSALIVCRQSKSLVRGPMILPRMIGLGPILAERVREFFQTKPTDRSFDQATLIGLDLATDKFILSGDLQTARASLDQIIDTVPLEALDATTYDGNLAVKYRFHTKRTVCEMLSQAREFTTGNDKRRYMRIVMPLFGPEFIAIFETTFLECFKKFLIKHKNNEISDVIILQIHTRVEDRGKIEGIIRNSLGLLQYNLELIVFNQIDLAECIMAVSSFITVHARESGCHVIKIHPQQFFDTEFLGKIYKILSESHKVIALPTVFISSVARENLFRILDIDEGVVAATEMSKLARRHISDRLDTSLFSLDQKKMPSDTGCISFLLDDLVILAATITNVAGFSASAFDRRDRLLHIGNSDFQLIDTMDAMDSVVEETYVAQSFEDIMFGAIEYFDVKDRSYPDALEYSDDFDETVERLTRQYSMHSPSPPRSHLLAHPFVTSRNLLARPTSGREAAPYLKILQAVSDRHSARSEHSELTENFKIKMELMEHFDPPELSKLILGIVS